MLTLAVHLWALYTPGSDLPPASDGTDKIAHVLLFGVPAALGAYAVRPWWAMPLALALHAPVSEVLQRLVPGRSSDPLDALADLSGIALGAYLGYRLARRRTPPAVSPGRRE